MIKRYQLFLESKKVRSIDISTQETIKLINENCKEFLIDKTPKMYRGYVPQSHPVQNTMLIKPSEFERRSANTKNIYTLIIDNSPRWKDFPKRKNSIICTTSINTANDYGYTYVVIPYDGAKIGVCPNNDIWNSFYKSLGAFINMDQFVFGLHEAGVDDSNFNLMKIGFDKLEKEMKSSKEDRKWSILSKLGKATGHPDVVSDLKNKYLDYIKDKDITLYEYVENMLDPIANHFRVCDYLDIPKHESKRDMVSGFEVWTESNCILIHEQFFSSILKELN